MLDMIDRLKIHIPNYFHNKFEIQRNKKIEKKPEIITVIPRIKEIKKHLIEMYEITQKSNYGNKIVLLYNEEINEILLEDIEILKNNLEKKRTQISQFKNELLENFKKTYKKELNEAQIEDYINNGLRTVNEYDALGTDEEEILFEICDAEKKQNLYNINTIKK